MLTPLAIHMKLCTTPIKRIAFTNTISPACLITTPLLTILMEVCVMHTHLTKGNKERRNSCIILFYLCNNFIYNLFYKTILILLQYIIVTLIVPRMHINMYLHNYVYVHVSQPFYFLQWVGIYTPTSIWAYFYFNICPLPYF